MIGKIHFDARLVIFHSWFWLCISCIYWITLVLILYSLFCLRTNPYSYVSTLPYFGYFWDIHSSFPCLFGSFDMQVMLWVLFIYIFSSPLPRYVLVVVFWYASSALVLSACLLETLLGRRGVLFCNTFLISNLTPRLKTHFL